MLLISILLLASIISYSPSDPNFIYESEKTEIKNIAGFYGSVVSDFFLQSLGLISFLLIFNFFYWGIKLITEKKISNFLTKTFFVLIYIILGTTVLNILYTDSFWLIDNGNGGFVGRIIKENIYYFTPLIENQYVIYFFVLLTIVFFTLSLSIKMNEILKILFFPYLISKKILNLFKKSKKITDIDENFSNNNFEENYEKSSTKENQPILHFFKECYCVAFSLLMGP